MFERFDGYTNVVDRERLSPRDLFVAMDIDLDDSGQPHRRRGRTVVATGDFHSLWNASDETVYCAKNGHLGILRPDYSFVDLNVQVGAYAPGALPITYAQVGDDIYFSSAGAAGIIRHSLGTVDPWGPSQDIWLSPVVDPTATLPAIAGRLLGAPPLADFILAFNGRIYLARGRTLWATEFLFPNYVDRTKNFFQFEANITLLGSVSDGLYVGTTEGLYFLAGRRLQDFQRVRAMDSGVLPGSAVSIPAELANPPQVGPSFRPNPEMEVSLGFVTTRGFCVGTDGGRATNLTEARVFFPVGVSASAFFRRQDGMNHYVVCLNSGGDPTNGARFGDFVDPQIARGKVIWVDVSEYATATEQVS